MGTESENEGGPGFEESIGLSATAHGKPAHRRSLPHIAPQHQQAVHLSVAARRHAREGREEEARRLFRQAAGRRLTFIMDEEASSAREIGDVNPITFIIPVCRPNEETLSVIEDSLSRRWRRRPQA